MADVNPPKQVDAIMAPSRPEAKPFTVPQAPAQAKKKRMGRKWLMRVLKWLLIVLPLIVLAIVVYVVYAMHQPQPVHRTHITPVTPKAVTTPKS